MKVTYLFQGSSSCPATPTSHCVIQYVIFPPHIIYKDQQQRNNYGSIVDILKKKNNSGEIFSSTSSIEEFDKLKKQGKSNIISEADDSLSCCFRHGSEDDYQLITECWIEPQHGTVVPGKNKHNTYMSGLMYEQLADAVSTQIFNIFHIYINKYQGWPTGSLPTLTI